MIKFGQKWLGKAAGDEITVMHADEHKTCYRYENHDSIARETTFCVRNDVFLSAFQRAKQQSAPKKNDNKPHTGFHCKSGVQQHSAGSHYPVVIVCVGGFPTADNEHYCELLVGGETIGPFNTHAEAEAEAIKIAANKQGEN